MELHPMKTKAQEVSQSTMARAGCSNTGVTSRVLEGVGGACRGKESERRVFVALIALVAFRHRTHHHL